MTRTRGTRFRKPLLYPPELRGQLDNQPTRAKNCSLRAQYRAFLLFGIVLDQGEDVVIVEALSAFEELQLHEKDDPGHDATQFFD